MKTDILLAVYNGEAYLPALLDSLAAQTYGNFHVLFQDDGSTDGTVELLRARAEADTRLIGGSESGRHKGAAGNFISLLRQSSADRILLCDQDDIWLPEKTALLMEEMDRAEAACPAGTPLLVHSDCAVIDVGGKVLFPSFFRLQGWNPHAVTLPPLLVQNNVTGCTTIINRPLADLAARYADPSRMFMHDWFLALTAASFGRVVFLDRALTRYRQHEGNAIGASRTSLLRRGLKALEARDQARERIVLTYEHTQAFRDAFGDRLPSPAAAVIREYLATRNLPKWKRIHAIRKQGCVMQSRVTRLGQILFG